MKFATVAKRPNRFFTEMAHRGQALTFDDVLLEPRHSDVLPKETNLDTLFSRKVKLRIPFASAAMDTVTDKKLGIGIGERGGIGSVHKNMPPREQAKHVASIKHFLNGVIAKPICVDAHDTIAEVYAMKARHDYNFDSLPVIREGKQVGLLTHNDFDFVSNVNQRVSEIMTPRRKLTMAPAGTTIGEAWALMRKTKKKTIPLIDADGCIAGMYVFKDLARIHSNQSMHNVDAAGHLFACAAVGVLEGAYERAELLAAEHCDVFHVDTAHGDTDNVIETVRTLKRLYPDIDVVAGNISTAAAAKLAVDAGADGILVGQGGGSICTTRIISGHGKPQLTAIYECARAIRGSGVPVCADGGIRYSGDIILALAAGADCVMAGNIFAGTDESPGEIETRDGILVKVYRGMGSLGAMAQYRQSQERYRQTGVEAGKLVPEGIEGVVPYRGSLESILVQLVGGVRAGLAYAGAHNLREFHARALLMHVTSAGQTESHPHDIRMTVEAPNYAGRK